MDAVLRALAIYAFLLVLFRLMGKRTMSQVTTFDFLILLVFSEATQQAILGEDFSITHAALVISTLLVVDRGSDYLSWRFPRFRKMTDSMPVVLVENGAVLDDVLRKEHLSVDDIMKAARESQGLERLEQVKWAVLETSGGISIVPRTGQPARETNGEDG